MKKRNSLVAGFVIAGTLIAGPVNAQTLEEALALAYENNPTLLAQRAALRAVDETVPQALSGWRPTVSLSGDVGATRIESGPVTDNRTPHSIGINVSQPLYRGGRTVAATNQAEETVLAQRALLQATEQTVLLNSATAYLNVVRDQAVLALTQNNEEVLRRQLEAASDRFRVGEITRTDVSQAEARLARALADRRLAEGNLEASRAAFQTLVGIQPGNLQQPPRLGDLPVNLEESVTLAAAANPSVLSTEYAARAAGAGVDLVRGELLPTVSLNGAALRGWDQGASDNVEQYQATVNVTVPLYEAGAVYGRLRQQKHIAGQRQIEVDEARRNAIELAAQSWEGLQTARASIEAFNSQINAARLALEGVREEALVGARTVLDVLDAEQELLDAQVSLVRAQRDEQVAAFQLRSAVGSLTAMALGLPVTVYDPIEHYEQTRGRWIGSDIITDPGN
ncbi:TolC family outer membrane protein [Telmatospirillum sp. J64-1]|uniref:TolC family outer membrane protein n=1 Tax=Telmatospirillum sp. J64-1 TaxID=2502183 RepID=UPI00115E3803|nr:TolC family outer membrane protein [Telmatospirillum sp. J64-1]